MVRRYALIAAVCLLALCGALIVGVASRTPPVLAGAALPAFSLPRTAAGAPPLTEADLAGRVVLVNFFASWCGPCRAEHPLLMELQAELPIIGINYMDAPDDARDFLAKLGNPYRDIAVDRTGEMGRLLNMDSVPRTLLVADGRVVYAHRGRLLRPIIDADIRPLIQKLTDA